MKKHEEAIQLIDGQVGLLSLNLRQDPGLYDEEKKHELRVRIEELEKTKLCLVLNQTGGK